MRIATFALAVLLTTPATLTLSGPLEDALLAHDEGRYAEAREMLLPLARAGDVDAQNKLSHMHWYGEGAPSDYAEAERWSRLAAARGSAVAHFDIGAHYRTGKGVPQSDRLAFEWQLKAAERGDPWGARNMVVLYRDGIGTERDLAKSQYWQQKALEMGDPTIQQMTAARYLMLGSAGKSEAEPLLHAAAAQHLAMAQLFLGKILLEGELGWPQDLTQARLWLGLAAANGCLEAPALLKRASATMTAAEQAAAMALVEAWQQANPRPLGSVHPIEPTSCVSQPRSSV